MAWKAAVAHSVLMVSILLRIDKGGCDFLTDQDNLLTALLANHTVRARPALKTRVDIAANICSLNYLNIAMQAMSVNMFLIVAWYDTRLVWNPANYGNLSSINVYPGDIWSPPILVDNAMGNIGVVGGISKDATPLKVFSNGWVNWYPISEFTTSCQMLISHYPFDTQVCTVDVIGWTYPLSELNITTYGEIQENTFISSGELDLIKTDSYISNVGGPAEENTYCKVKFEFTWRRRWQFYGQNLLLPIMLNSILMTAVFALPIESGEKMSYCLTVLLSYIVFLTWVTENLPPVSNAISVLQIYLAIVLCMGCLATILTLWVLHVFHKPADMAINCFYRRFASHVLVPFHRLTLCNVRPVAGKTGGSDPQSHNNRATATHVTHLTLRPESSSTSHKIRPNNRNNDDDSNVFNADQAVDKDAADDDVSRTTTPAPTWAELAALMDCFFLWVFGLLLLSLTCIIVLLLYSRY